MIATSSTDSSQPEGASPEPDRQKQEDAPDSRPPIALPEGTRLRDEYRVGPVLGMGSFGITYRARDLHLDTTVAIKEYYPRHLAGRTSDSLTVRPHSEDETDTFTFGRERFRQEGQMLARFDHPNVVQVRSYFEGNGTGYLVMDYYEGQTLEEALAQHGGTLPEAEAVRIIRSVMSGLQPVHEDGILHRDIDPQNVYLTSEGEVVIIDFGAAREAVGERSQNLSVILKPGYAPYEQYHGNKQGPWTDVYACAATLYRCLTGLRPPDATQRLQNDDLVSPREAGADVSMDLSLAVMKGLALDPKQRPASAEAFDQLLDEAQRGGGSTIPAPELPDADRDNSSSPSTSDSTPKTLQTTSAGEVDETERGSTGQWIFMAALAGTLGLVLGVGNGSGTTSVFSFAGTWLVVSLGLVGLFREAENAMTKESRTAVRDWLLQQDLVSQSANWPSTFTSLFDAIFTEEHLSWTCFRRSAFVSVVTVLVVLMGVIGIGLLPADRVWTLLQAGQSSVWYNLIVFLGWSLSFNAVVDYLSLLETRLVLGRMSQSDHSAVHFAYLGFDLILTAAIFIGTIALVQPLAVLLFRNVTLFSVEGIQAIWEGTRRAVHLTGKHFLRADYPPAVMIYSTLFTSVWVWLYAGAGLLLRLLHPVLRGLDVLKQHFDVESRPVYSIGVLLAVFSTGAFLLASPFVL